MKPSSSNRHWHEVDEPNDRRRRARRFLADPRPARRSRARESTCFFSSRKRAPDVRLEDELYAVARMSVSRGTHCDSRAMVAELLSPQLWTLSTARSRADRRPVGMGMTVEKRAARDVRTNTTYAETRRQRRVG